MRIATLITLAALTTLVCGTACAQWKWRDATGRITVSDLPPPGGIAERDILERPTDQRLRPAAPRAALPASAASSPAAASARRGVDPELEARRKSAADEQAAQLKEQQDRDAANRAENCARTRAQMAVLSSGRRMARANAQGDSEVLDDRGREAEIQRARVIIASDCR